MRWTDKQKMAERATSQGLSQSSKISFMIITVGMTNCIGIKGIKVNDLHALISLYLTYVYKIITYY